ncbi:hypothetical protein [Luteimonas sp. FCS-9]|uniref:hypothetical protein n=1 Tax=Luteimonas sp. FCS-9 TaxID=1547516 RepID=UPI0012E05B6C|nr:hypothetical protein [Luteimonas sp. FCS-9]
MIDLVIENIGGGSAIGVAFSEPLPIDCFGIGKSDGSGSFVSKDGFPSLSAGQRYTFNGGQYSGLEGKMENGLRVQASYKYRNPLGFLRKATDEFTLGITHLGRMPTKTSANQAIVDALKGPNKTTMQEIRDELRSINKHLKLLTKRRERQDGDIGA